MGFDRPWYVQYFSFVGKALQGDFGYSFIRHKPAYEVITERLPATIQLATFAFVLSLIVSIPLGVLSATRAQTPIDHIASVRGADRPVDPELLARHPADPVLRRPSEMAADLRQRHLAASHHARHHARRLPDRAEHAPDALVDARLHAARFRAHRSRQGHFGNPCRLRACAAQFAAADRHRDRPRDRLSPRRLGDHRDDLRLARASAARSSRRSGRRTSTSCRPA